MADLVAQLLANGIYIFTMLILVVCGMGLPIPEEGVFLTAGYVASQPSVNANVWVLCVFGVVGIMLGDSIPFLMGRKYGMDILKRPFFAKFLPPARIEKTKHFFAKHGSKTIFVARFIAGVRMPTFLMAGCMGTPYMTFFIWDLMGALISCPTSIWLAYYYGPHAEEIISENRLYLFIFLGLVAAYIAYAVISHRPKKEDAEPAAELSAGASKPAEINGAPLLKTDVLRPEEIQQQPE